MNRIRLPRHRISHAITCSLYLMLVATSANCNEPLPLLSDLLKEADQAAQKLVERDGDLSFAVATTYGALAQAACYQRNRALATKYAIAGFGEDVGIKLVEDLAAEIDGTVPSTFGVMDPFKKLLRIRDIVIGLTKYGDFNKACVLIASYPTHPNRLRYQFDSYYFVAERQLQQHDESGARETINRLLDNVERAGRDKPEDRGWRLVKIAELAQ